jgi:hypothetical protein
MYKAFNFLFIILIFFFFFNIYNFYKSGVNLKTINFNRQNIERIISEKLLNVPILDNDTKNVIEFNNSLSNENNNNKPRSFWKLLKIK